jgi:hypothetical protein
MGECGGGWADDAGGGGGEGCPPSSSVCDGPIYPEYLSHSTGRVARAREPVCGSRFAAVRRAHCHVGQQRRREIGYALRHTPPGQILRFWKRGIYNICFNNSFLVFTLEQALVDDDNN